MNSTAAIGVTVRRDSSLRNRVLSALVLGAISLALLWLGGLYWQAFVALAAAVLAWEWAALCAADRSAPAAQARLSHLRAPGMVVIFAVPGAVLTASFAGMALGLAVLLIGALVSAVTALLSQRERAPWYGLGILYVGLPCLAIIWLRDQMGGLWTVAWLLALVWATDTAAYAAGRRFGGAKLAPRISPNKTWSGFAGGIAGAVAIGLIAALLAGTISLWWMLSLSAALAILAQGGDLMESWVKRRVGVKDASALIPGHGGMLDRVDGLLVVAAAVAALQRATNGASLAWL